MSIYEKASLQIMDKKVVNKEQFRKLVIQEAKKYISEGENAPAEQPEKKTTRRITFDKVEGLISEMENMNNSISSIMGEGEVVEESAPTTSESPVETWKPNQDRDLDPIEHNRKKNFKHINESEKDRIKRMLDYNVPKDEDR